MLTIEVTYLDERLDIMLKKILWALAPVIASKLLNKRRQGQANGKYSRGASGKNYGKNYGKKRR